jgi:hypothetical protein
MNNVVRLFGKLPVENPAAAKANVTTPVAEMLRMSDQLGCTVAEISKQLDAVGDLMCEVGDLETRSRHRRLIRLHQEALVAATLQLSSAIRNLPMPQTGV